MTWVGLILLLLNSARCASAAIIAVPDTSSGNSESGAPFGIGAHITMRYQEVYASSSFAALGLQPGLITALAFRFEDVQTTGGFVPNMQLDLSTTARLVDGLSTTFALNVGSNDKVVYGPGVAAFIGTPGAPPGFPIMLTLARPFLYDPAQGNLLLDVRLNQSEGPVGIFDASNVVGDPVSIVYAFDVNATAGMADTLGLVTAFIVTPVPEPGSAMLFVAGLFLLALFGRRCGKRMERD